jgi:hypothetical protein
VREGVSARTCSSGLDGDESVTLDYRWERPEDVGARDEHDQTRIELGFGSGAIGAARHLGYQPDDQVCLGQALEKLAKLEKNRPALFEHLIRPQQRRLGNAEVERLRRLEVDHQRAATRSRTRRGILDIRRSIVFSRLDEKDGVSEEMLTPSVWALRLCRR